MCKGLPMTPGHISDFVGRWVACELAWFDGVKGRVVKWSERVECPASSFADEVEAFIAAHPHWEESVKREWREGVAAGDTSGLVRNRPLKYT